MLRVFRHYLSWHKIFLALADITILVGAAYAGRLTPLLGLPSLWLGYDPFLPKALTFVGLGSLILFVGGAYDLSPRQDRKEILLRLMACFVAITLFVSAVGFAFPMLRWGRLALVLALVVGCCAVTAVRIMSLKLWDTPHFRERLLLLGATPLADRMIETIAKMGARGFEVVGYVDNGVEIGANANNGYRVLGKVTELENVAAMHRAGTIVVTLDERRGTLPLDAILDCKLRGIRVEDWPSFYERLTGRIGIENLRPSWMVFSDGFHRASVTRTVKRAMDIALALVFLVLGFPVFVLIAVAIELESRGPVFFRKEGAGGDLVKGRRFRAGEDLSSSSVAQFQLIQQRAAFLPAY